MADLIRAAAKDAGRPKFFVSSAQPRLVDGKMTKNPRYLQNRFAKWHQPLHRMRRATSMQEKAPHTPRCRDGDDR